MDGSDSQTGGLSGSEVAIIAMAGRFPGAADLDRFWENLKNGIESVRTFTDEELRAAGVGSELLADPAYVKAAPVLDGVELFDAALFGMSPREARLVDPQQRALLEIAWEALEQAGYDSELYTGTVGVFAGTERSMYVSQLISDPEILATESPLSLEVSNGHDYLATRISYELGLRGPSLTVQTACSTSLVAIHLACQSLLCGECDMALAGGITIRLPQIAGYLPLRGGIRSPDGHCRAFDAGAQGTVFGSGAGLVVLKRLAEALTDRDTVRAVIKGSAVNNDGSLKVGFTAPGGEGQAQVIRAAHIVSEIDPETITYIEAHGTGTPLGDPIEVSALTRAFRMATDRISFCALGSVKTNVGHLQCAAGVAGVIKTVLSLEHGLLPPSLHFERPNPHIDFAGSPFYVNDQLAAWNPAPGAPRRAGVSSFGIGGTNGHIVLEEAPPAAPSGPSRTSQLLVLSARTPTALAALRSNLAEHFLRHPGPALADAAFTLAVGRRAGRHRCAVVCRDSEEAASLLASPSSDRVYVSETDAKDRTVVFLFPGQGAQHPGMSRELYDRESVFREGVDLSCEILRPLLGLDLRTVIYPPAGKEEEAARRLEQTALAQPALFAVEHSLAKLWMEWGVRPRAMLGHSLGEYVAACLAGVFSLEDALTLVAERGRLMQGLPAGSMLSVPLPEEEVEPFLRHGIALAAVNGAARMVLSGPAEAVAAVAAELAARGVAAKPLATSHAFHSAMMEPAVAPFRELVEAMRREPPRIPFVSNTTGTWITNGEAVDAAYWARHLRQTVRFSAGLGTLAEDPAALLLEVGPGQSLSSLARQRPGRPGGQPIVRSLPHPREARPADEVLTAALGQMWNAGARIDWPAYFAGERRRRLRLPTYPFERQRFWVEPNRTPRPAASSRTRREIGDWFYVPYWKPAAPPPRADAEGSRWLLLADRFGLAETMARRLREGGAQVLLVSPGMTGGEGFAETSADWKVVDGENTDAFTSLLAHLSAAGARPDRIVHLWGVGPMAPEEAESLCFRSLLHLAQSLGRDARSDSVELRVVLDGLQSVRSEAVQTPEKALALGPVKVLPQEVPWIGCAAIDIQVPQEPGAMERLADSLIAEAMAPADEPVIAYRDEQRWVEAFEPVHLGSVEAERLPFRERGVYLITGGLGGIGLTLARELARTCRARLVLTSRTPLPERLVWEHWLETSSPATPASRKIRELLELERLGAEVLPLAADVTSEAAMREAVLQARARFGPIQGVVHAAGLPGGGVIARKTREAADAVLAPKVRGTRVLAAVLRDEPIEVFVLCSSTFAVTGGAGQVDYCAANSFLDAFARTIERQGARVVSLAWGGWREVGMAVATGRRLTATAGPPSAHPLLDRRLSDGSGWTTELSPSRHWILDEHRLRGTPIVPGTAYLEMARAAFALETGAREIEIRGVDFVSPLLVADGDFREVRVLLAPGDLETSFRIISRQAAEDTWREHARGRLAAVAEDPPSLRADLADLAQRCQQQLAVGAALNGGQLVSWGPRWKSLLRADVGQEEALLLLQLPDEFIADVDQFGLHPALLDVATAFGGAFMANGNALPHSYGLLRFRSPLPDRLYAHVRRQTAAETAGDTVTDVTLFGPDGTVHVEIERFTMRGLADTQGDTATARDATVRRTGRDPETASWISPDEGVEAFRRVLSRSRFSNVAVSPNDLVAAITAARGRGRQLVPDRGSRFPRPDIAATFAAPTEESEAALAEIWRNVLGLESVGIDDNFFDLGGDSVVAIQVVAVAARSGLSLSPEMIFERQTIRALAAGLDPRQDGQAPPSAIFAQPSPGTESFSETGLSQESIERLLAKVKERT